MAQVHPFVIYYPCPWGVQDKGHGAFAILGLMAGCIGLTAQEHRCDWLGVAVQEPVSGRDGGALSARVPVELASEHDGDVSCVTRGH